MDHFIDIYNKKKWSDFWEKTYGFRPETEE